MKQTRLLLRTFVFAALLGAAASATSCNPDGKEGKVVYGTVSGIVTDENNLPVSDATVSVSGVPQTVSSGTDGSYSIANVSNERHSVIAVKDGYQSASKTVRAESFSNGKVENLNLSLLRANTKISGMVLDARNNNAPLANVVVKAGSRSVQSDADGKFEISKLALADYAVSFTFSNYPVVTLNIAKGKFVDEAIDVGSIYVGGGDILRTLDRYELAEAAKLLYDDYRAGNARGPISGGTVNGFWDWSTGYMAAVVERLGNIELQNEGFALRPTNSALNALPDDLDNFDSFFYGLKKITATNCKVTVRVRCHQAPSTFGVQVVDLNAPSPTAVKIATFTHPSDSYISYPFDLSAYIGKEVLVVVGQYIDYANNSPTATDYWHQLPVARLTFSSDYLASTDTWWPGDEVIPGWKLTKQMVANTGVQTLTSFTGLSPDGAGNNHGGIGRWKGTSHIGAHWHLIAVSKDVEPVKSEGFIIKTTNPGTVNTMVPESFIYAKFRIASGADKIVVRARTMSATDSYFKFAAFDEAGTLLGYITPTGTGVAGSAGPDNTWKFNRNSSDYAQFEFDLSAYQGQNVTVAFGVIKGAASAEENKIAIQSIVLE